MKTCEAALASVLFLAACSGGNATVSGADAGSGPDASRPALPAGTIEMNDVSILLPLPRSTSDANFYLRPSTAARGGPLVPQALYDAATGEDSGAPPAPGSPTAMPYADLRLVAIRIDPCFANIGKITEAASCLNQMRLVFQPVDLSESGDTAVTSDAALHAFYALTRQEVVDLAAAIAALRVASGRPDDLGPLAVHPIVASEGAGGKFAQGLFALVAKSAGEGNLTRFTRFTSSGPQWFFSGFDVAGGASTPMVIPTLPAGATQVEFSAGFDQTNIQGVFIPETSARDDVKLLADTSKATAASPSDREAAYGAAMRIQNPNFYSPNTIDCATCHVAGPAVAVVAGPLGLAPKADDTNVFRLDSPFVPVADMAQTTNLDPPASFLDLHVFSYKDGTPSIAPRVINETAAVVDYLNGLRPQGP